MFHFKILKKSKKSNARLGVLKTAHGNVKTPFFMPVATRGAVKHISPKEILFLEAQIILANTYHLMLRPGEKQISRFGGLHNFIGWDKAILTDSGGFQVFSLSGVKNKKGESLVKLTRNGVKFKSYIDGKEYYLTPEKSLKIQLSLGVDIAVCLDECVALPASYKYIKKSVELTTYWARKTKRYYKRVKERLGSSTLLFAVVQGGLDKELRLQSLNDLVEVGFDGYNIGGLSVGESTEEMYEVLSYLVPIMPVDKPRYLMGVGYPENIVEAVKYGVDMFDCVIPTREGRHGRLFMRTAPILDQKFYTTININRARFTRDDNPINPASKIKELRELSRAYLHYLFKIKEPLASRLATLNNIEFYLDLMQEIRDNIKMSKF